MPITLRNMPQQAATCSALPQAPSYTRNPHNGDVYSAYNKPEAVIDWLAHNDIEEEFVLILDADMIMRAPFIPEDLGAKEGTAISAYYGYLKVHGLALYRCIAHSPGRCQWCGNDDVPGSACHYLSHAEKNHCPTLYSSQSATTPCHAFWPLHCDEAGISAAIFAGCRASTMRWR
jgi:hypothetical protein